MASSIRKRTYLYYKKLIGYTKILSVGCGPGMIEQMLNERDFEVTGLDVSEEAFSGAPDSIRKVVGTAEIMNFHGASFDAVIYVVVPE